MGKCSVLHTQRCAVDEWAVLEGCLRAAAAATANVTAADVAGGWLSVPVGGPLAWAGHAVLCRAVPGHAVLCCAEPVMTHVKALRSSFEQWNTPCPFVSPWL